VIYDYHTVFGLIASFLGIVSFIPYLRDIFRGTTKPHPFSWFVWGLITGIGFSAQYSAGGGTGAWITGITSLECFTIAGLAFYRGEKRIVPIDWICFVLALGGLILWRLTASPLSAIIVVMLVDALAAIPTFRKSYLRPYEETVATYAIGGAGFFCTLFALASFNFATALFPAYVSLSNAGFVALLLFRRKQMRTRRR